MSFSHFLIILKARWKAALGVFLGVILIVLAITLILPKQYKATAAVLIDVKSPDPIAGMVLPGMMAPGYLATQLDVLQSERVALGAIRMLRLNEVEALKAQWRDQTDGLGSYESWLAELLQNGLDIKPSRESSVISISYKAVDPQFAAVITNAFVKSYINTTLELRVEPAKQYGTLFETQAKQLRERLEEAQAKLSAYQRDHGLIATDERLDVENARLNDLSSQLVALQALSAEASSRKTNTGENTTEVLNSMVVSTLKADLARQEGRLKELMARYGNSYPAVQETQANVAELKERIAAETRRISTSVGVSNTITQSREAQARAALEQQRQKLLKLKEQRDEASVLLRDVESAQRAYENMNLRLSQSSVESQSTQTNVSVVKEATAPASPASPRIALNMVLAVFVGLVLSVATAVMLELRNRLLRTDEDVVDGLEVPVLGVMPLSDTPGARKISRQVRPELPPHRALPELAAPQA